MAMPDIGLQPPPPPGVAAQLQPSTPAAGGDSGSGGAPNLASILAGLAGAGGPPPLSADITPKVMAIEPLLSQIASQVPALGPDVDKLNVELQSRMGGLPSALSGLAGQGSAQPAQPTPMGPSYPGSNPGAPAPAPPGPPANMPTPPSTNGGAMDTAMQIEVQLPAIGSDDPTLMPYIQGFIARMREEVPKVVQGETESINPPTQSAPTESMLSKIPVNF